MQCAIPTMNSLEQVTPEQRETANRLRPLLEGKTVIFQVNDTRVMRHTLKRAPVLALTPLAPYVPDATHGEILVSLEGKGCWVVKTRPKVEAFQLMAAGLPLQLARLMATELNRLFNYRGK